MLCQPYKISSNHHPYHLANIVAHVQLYRVNALVKHHPDEENGNHTCKDVMAFCSGDDSSCGDLNEVRAHLLGKGCCTEGSPICRVGSVLVADHIYEVRGAFTRSGYNVSARSAMHSPTVDHPPTAAYQCVPNKLVVCVCWCDV